MTAKKFLTYIGLSLSLILLLCITYFYTLYISAVLRGEISAVRRLSAADLTVGIGLFLAILGILNPWMFDKINAVKLPGGLEVTLKEIERKVEANAGDLKEVRAKLGVLSHPEHYHLKQIGRKSNQLYETIGPLIGELNHLLDQGLIVEKRTEINWRNLKQFKIAEHFEITSEGKRYLKPSDFQD